jgi:hypothetical protein
VETQIALFIETRLMTELERPPSASSLAFTSNRFCLEAYKKFMCHINFPECSKDSKPLTLADESFPVCDTECIEMYTECEFSVSECTKKKVTV